MSLRLKMTSKMSHALFEYIASLDLETVLSYFKTKREGKIIKIHNYSLPMSSNIE